MVKASPIPFGRKVVTTQDLVGDYERSMNLASKALGGPRLFEDIGLKSSLELESLLQKKQRVLVSKR